jgi:hypothetical protein
VNRRSALTLLAGGACLALAGLPTAVGAREKKEDKPKPEIKSVSTLAVPAGKTATLTIYGENLHPTSVAVNKGPLAVKLLETKDTDEATKKAYDNAAKQVTLEVSAPADCPPDTYELVLVHEGDVKANARVAVVEPAATEVEVKRPNASVKQAMPLEGPFVAVPAPCKTTLPTCSVLDAKAGEAWEITLLAGRVGAPTDPIIRLRDSRHLSLALAAGDENQDRKLRYTFSADGPYFIELTEAEGRGGPRFLYRLTVKRVEK